MEPYQFFKIYKRFDKERKKLIQQSMRKKKLRKNGLYFVTGCFIRPFKIIIIFFYFGSSFAAQFSLFVIKMTQEISKGEIGNGK